MYTEIYAYLKQPAGRLQMYFIQCKALCRGEARGRGGLVPLACGRIDRVFFFLVCVCVCVWFWLEFAFFFFATPMDGSEFMYARNVCAEFVVAVVLGLAWPGLAWPGLARPR